MSYEEILIYDKSIKSLKNNNIILITADIFNKKAYQKETYQKKFNTDKFSDHTIG